MEADEEHWTPPTTPMPTTCKQFHVTILSALSLLIVLLLTIWCAAAGKLHT